MIEPCISCGKTTCKTCVYWAAFECDLCRRNSCQGCRLFKYALWVLAGLLEKPELEAVFWP